MTTREIVVHCPCGEEHTWWHQCILPSELTFGSIETEKP